MSEYFIVLFRLVRVKQRIINEQTQQPTLIRSLFIKTLTED